MASESRQTDTIKHTAKRMNENSRKESEKMNRTIAEMFQNVNINCSYSA